ncbi:type II secretion system protein GspM [Marinomonas atlantica]|uniref:type II secretion system protein GspM n=1 Tax=Marinomonas atlantica TaxID=1806668 RepID=UPI0008330919|nr:type II secretion system protein GspM [Marinomonas atlantica]
MKSWFVQQLQQSTVLQRMMISFQARSARERLLILVMVSVFVLVIVFYTIIEPSQAAHQQAITRLSTAQNQYQRLVMSAEVLAQARSEQELEDRDTNALRNVLTQTANQAGFVADRIQVEREGRIQVWSSRVPFTILSAWFEALGEQRVGIESMQIEKIESGLVSLRITLD